MRKDIVIVGNGGFAHEVAFLIERINAVEKKWNFLGYIAPLAGDCVIGDDKFVMDYDGELYVAIGIGSPAMRKKVADKYSPNGEIHYPNLIDPSVVIGKDVSLGVGNIICANCVLTVNIRIGDGNIINLGCTVGHDTIIGDFNTIYPGSNISGNVVLEQYIEIGTGTKVIQGLKIAKETTIGAGAVVIDSLPGQCTAVGIPARVVKVGMIKYEEDGYVQL